jgi:response regulator of citrate/malate metabolism
MLAEWIVLITGDPDEALAREALARGPVGYLLKPFEL